MMKFSIIINKRCQIHVIQFKTHNLDMICQTI